MSFIKNESALRALFGEKAFKNLKDLIDPCCGEPTPPAPSGCCEYVYTPVIFSEPQSDNKISISNSTFKTGILESEIRLSGSFLLTNDNSSAFPNFKIDYDVDPSNQFAPISSVNKINIPVVYTTSQPLRDFGIGILTINPNPLNVFYFNPLEDNPRDSYFIYLDGFTYNKSE